MYQASSPTKMLWDYILIARKKKKLQETQVYGEITNRLLKKSKGKLKKKLETNDNENMTTQNLWDAAKAVLREKFIAIKSNLKKQEKH